MEAGKARIIEAAIKAIEDLERLFESLVREHRKHCATCSFTDEKDLCARLHALSEFFAVMEWTLERVFGHFTEEELKEADQVFLAILAQLYYRSFILSPGGLLVVAHGESMRPQIEDGDILVLVPVAPGEVRVGDIVAYPKSIEDTFVRWAEHKPRVLFTIHRVIRIDDEHIITKGDAATGEDKPIDKLHPLWKVIRIIKNGTPLWEQLYSDAIDRGRLFVIRSKRRAA